MPDPRDRFADRLLAADPTHPTARGRYDQQVRAMLETSLTPLTRGVALLGAVATLGVTGLLAFMTAIAEEPNNPVVPYFRAFCLLSAGVTAMTAWMLLRAFWRGTIHQPTSGVRATGVVIAYTAVVGWLTMSLAGHLPDMLGNNPRLFGGLLARNDTRVFGGVLVLYAAVAWVRSRVASAELATAERLLELELRLAEMQETLRAGRT